MTLPMHRRPGAMLLMTVLIVGATALLIALGVTLHGIEERDMGLAEAQSAEALAIADGCAQEALLQLSLSIAYTGASLMVGDGSCTIAVTDMGPDKQIVATGTVDRWSRTLTILVDVSGGSLSVLSWRQGA